MRHSKNKDLIDEIDIFLSNYNNAESLNSFVGSEVFFEKAGGIIKLIAEESAPAILNRVQQKISPHLNQFEKQKEKWSNKTNLYIIACAACGVSGVMAGYFLSTYNDDLSAVDRFSISAKLGVNSFLMSASTALYSKLKYDLPQQLHEMTAGAILTNFMGKISKRKEEFNSKQHQSLDFELGDDELDQPSISTKKLL